MWEHACWFGGVVGSTVAEGGYVEMGLVTLREHSYLVYPPPVPTFTCANKKRQKRSPEGDKAA